MRSAFLSGLLLVISSILYSQDVNPKYFDGEIYLKVTAEYAAEISQKDGKVNLETFKMISDVQDEFQIEKVRSSFYFAKDEGLRRTFRVYFNDYSEINAFLDYLKNQSGVEYAEPVPLHRTTLTPDDLGNNNTGSSGQWSLYRINAQEAWDISTGSDLITVAVVDDAVQTTHPDLSGVCLTGRDVTDNDNDPNPPNNDFDHGTHVAGIVGAETDNGIGFASIGFGISILPVKATDEVEFITDGYEGIVWAVDNGADVINLSWGGSGGSQTGQNIINNGYNEGVVIVAAAGNDDVSTTFFPAGFNHVISVASTTTSDAKSSFSNFGSWIDISSPGSSIRSTVPTNGYGSKSGTSMASPLVAGLCGLMLSANPNLNPDEVLECLQLSADNIDGQNSNYIGQLGAGRINAEAALECAGASALAYDAALNAITSPTGSSCNTTFAPQVTIRNTGQLPITSLVLEMNLDGNNIGDFTWNGNLTSQQVLSITIPDITTIIGNHTLNICTSTINGNIEDEFDLNNCRSVNFSIVSPIGLSLPFTETFESGSLATNGWSIENADNGLGWEIIQTEGTEPGNRSARIPFYSYNAAGERDALVTPTLNFAAYTDLTLSFDHAYRRYSSNATDSLIISISTDCGETYSNRIFVGGENGTGSFATAAISETNFVPSGVDDWCNGPIGSSCVTIDLDEFSGNSSVRIKFEGYNNYGNNLYLDNINIDGVIAGAPAIADFTVAGSSSVCEGSDILFTNLSGNQPGEYSWNFEGGTPSTSNEVNPTIRYNSPGVYQVTLTASNIFGEDTEVKTSFINVQPAPALGVTADPPVTCQGTPSELTGLGADNYEWSPAVAISSSFGEVITANPPTTTTYTLIGQSAAGCVSEIDFTLIVNPRPDIPQINEDVPGLLSTDEGFTFQWFLNGNAIDGAIDSEYSPLEDGSYQVEITDDKGCKRMSNSFNFEGSVSFETIFSDQITLAPNPASNFVQVNGLNHQFEYEIIQLDGKVVKVGSSNNGLINTTFLAKGIYFIKVGFDQYTAVKRLVINNNY